VAGVVVLGMLALLGGCGSDSVTVTAYDVLESARAGCAEVIADLPHEVAGQQQRTVVGSPYAAAWGDPAIVLRCGVRLPAGFTRTSECQTVNGIDWYVPQRASDDQGADVPLTLVHRSVVVSVVVPAKLRPPDAVLVDLGRVMAKATKATGHCV
jgi:hypothetical protein